MSQDAHQIREAIDRIVGRIRQDVETHLESLSSDLLRLAEHRDAHGAPDVKKAAVEIARAVARGGDQARHDLISRLATAVRALDDATTLRATLDALTQGAAAEAHRVAVLLVEDTQLRSWVHHGFPPGLGPVDLPVSASPLLATAIQFRQANPVLPAGPRPDASLPMFMRVPPGNLGQILPLVVAGQVVALVYAEGPDRAGDALGPPVWSEQVEVLVRHAAVRLENLTSRRAVEVLTADA
jgi:hypothetical protein